MPHSTCGRSSDGPRGVDRRAQGEDAPREAAETGSRHAARQLGCARRGVPLLHPVAAAPRWSRPGSALGHHRGDRVRAGRRRRVDLACLRRPGPPAATEPGLADLPGERRGAADVLVRAGPVLAVRDPGPHGGDGLQRRPGRGLSPGRRRDLLPAHPHRPRPSTRLPIGRTAAEAVGRPSCRDRSGLGPGRRPHLAGRHRAAARRAGHRRRQGLLAARHHDARGRAPADDRPALRRPRLRGAVGLPRLPGADVHRPRPVVGRHRRGDAPPGRGSGQGVRRARVQPRRRVPSGARGPGPRACGRLPAQEPAGGHHDRQRVGRPGSGGHVRVPHPRGRGDGRHPVLLPPVVDVLPGRPVQGARGRTGPVRRRLRPVVEAAGRPAPQALRRRREPGLLRGRDRLQWRVRPAQPHQRHVVRRPTQLQHAVPRVQRPSRPRQPGDPARLQGRAHRPVHQRGRGRDPPGGPALAGQPGPVPDASLRPHRVVEPEPHPRPSPRGRTNPPARTSSPGSSGSRS